MAILVLLSLGVTSVWLWKSEVSVRGESERSATKDLVADDAPPVSNVEPPKSEPAKTDLSALRQKVLPSLVTIFVGQGNNEGRGSGFVIEGGLIITAYHVASSSKDAKVEFQDGEQAAVQDLVTFDPRADLAVLKTRSDKERQPLRLATSMPAIGAQVAAFVPGGGELQGVVTGLGKTQMPGGGIESEVLKSTLNAVPGWSGGPVLNMDSEVVGINKRLDGAVFESKELKIASGSAAVPVTSLAPLLAILKLNAEIEFDPDNPVLRRERAKQYSFKGDFRNAIEDYTELSRLQPEDASAYCNRGMAYAQRGEYRKAADDYTKAIEKNRDFIAAYRGRAAIWEKTDNLDGAIADDLELIRLVPKAEADPLESRLARLYKDRARARVVARKLPEAIADLSAVIRLRPKDAEAYRDRAVLYIARAAR
jgi:tetratricopeptide (TPR) repeat protein